MLHILCIVCVVCVCVVCVRCVCMCMCTRSHIAGESSSNPTASPSGLPHIECAPNVFLKCS
jgi:hypothetical protein